MSFSFHGPTSGATSRCGRRRGRAHVTMFARPTTPVAAVPPDFAPAPAAAPPPPTRPRAWSLRNWPVRWKVFAIALLPLVLATTFGALRVKGEMANSSGLRLAAARANVIPAITNYMSALDVALLASSTGRDAEGAKKNFAARKNELQTRLADTEVIPDVRSGVNTLLNGGQALLDKDNSIGLRDKVTTYAPLLLTAEDAINASVRVDSEQIRSQVQGLSRAVGARGQMTLQEILVTRGADLPEPQLRTAMITLAGTEPSTLFGMSEVLGAGSPDAKNLQQQLVTRMAVISDPDSTLVDNPDLLRSIRTTQGIADQIIDDTTASVTKSVQDQATARRDAAIRDAVAGAGCHRGCAGDRAAGGPRAGQAAARVARRRAQGRSHRLGERDRSGPGRRRADPAAVGGVHHRGNRPGRPRRRRTAYPGPVAGRGRSAAARAGQRHVRDHVAAQPFPGGSAAVAHRPAGAQRGGSRAARQPVPLGSPGRPAAPQQRQPAGIGGRPDFA